MQRFLRSPSNADEGAFARGTLIMTGATSAWRGKEGFGAFAAGKHGLRALSQSVAREFGPRGVHMAFVVSTAGLGAGSVSGATVLTTRVDPPR